ncbi:MAG: Crp/Fnr family transcriptional regulator [Leptolyngbyaceae cyanobacterium SM1_3_5]|nr:Crp/Fnr family transcriptional regulator [Leptolyngbyaceae cyanobacterium SM1_3_5]
MITSFRLPQLITTPLTFKRRECLPIDQAALWRIESGAVRTLTFTEDGGIVTLGFWGAGDAIGSALSQIQPYQIECLTAVTAVAVSTHSADVLTPALFAHVQQVEELLRVRQGQIRKRLMQLFHWLAYKFGQPNEQGQRIELCLTHQDLADVVGTTRVTITRLIKLFEQEGIIDWSERYCVLLDRK